MLIPLRPDLGQIALMCDVKELSERSREDPDDDAGVQRRLLQVDTLAQTHRLEKFLQGQFGPDSRLSRLEKVCKLRWKLRRKITRFTAG